MNNTSIKLTPMQFVKSQFKNAVAKASDNNPGVWYVWDKTPNMGANVIGEGKNAGMAWKNAQEFVMNINTKTKKISGRRRRLLDRIMAGDYKPKTGENSRNINNRRT